MIDYTNRRFLIIRHSATGFTRAIMEGDNPQGHTMRIEEYLVRLPIGIQIMLCDKRGNLVTGVDTPSDTQQVTSLRWIADLEAFLWHVGYTCGANPRIPGQIRNARLVVEALGYETMISMDGWQVSSERASIGRCTDRCFQGGCTHPGPEWQAAWHDTCNRIDPGTVLARFSDHQKRRAA